MTRKVKKQHTYQITVVDTAMVSKEYTIKATNVKGAEKKANKMWLEQKFKLDDFKVNYLPEFESSKQD